VNGIWLVLFVSQWTLLLLLSAVLIGVLRYLSRIQDRIDLAAPQISRFETHQAVGDFELPTSEGTVSSLSSELDSIGPAVVLFLTPACGSCKAVQTQLVELASRRPAWGGAATKVVVVAGGGPLDADVSQSLSRSGSTVFIDKDGRAFGDFGIRSIPTGLSIDSSGVVSDQSMNPHAFNWLYRTLGVPPPAQPIQTGWGSLITPRADYVSSKQ
jgi:hypothetical protein